MGGSYMIRVQRSEKSVVVTSMDGFHLIFIQKLISVADSQGPVSVQRLRVRVTSD